MKLLLLLPIQPGYRNHLPFVEQIINNLELAIDRNQVHEGWSVGLNRRTRWDIVSRNLQCIGVGLNLRELAFSHGYCADTNHWNIQTVTHCRFNTSVCKRINGAVHGQHAAVAL